MKYTIVWYILYQLLKVLGIKLFPKSRCLGPYIWSVMLWVDEDDDDDNNNNNTIIALISFKLKRALRIK
jgi:hypothetical protein